MKKSMHVHTYFKSAQHNRFKYWKNRNHTEHSVTLAGWADANFLWGGPTK